MINIEEQQEIFITIGRSIKKKIIAYAVGGTAMMFQGYKESTLDIDLVFTTEEEKEIFKQALLSTGWKSMDERIVYGMKRNRPNMLQLGDARFDLFVVKIVNFEFSEGMKTRATQTRQYGDDLIIKVADPHDIILMKCATDRAKDKEDVKNIIQQHKNIDWNLLIQEAQQQIILGEERAVFELGCFLEHLNNDMHIPIPQKILDQLFTIVEKQAREKISRK